MIRVQAITVLVAWISISTGAAGDLGPLEPLADFHRAVHESLGLPEPLIVQLLERGAPEEHLPVIGLIAGRAGIAAESVFELHRSGLSYLQISLRFGFGPEIFYVPMAADPGPPYGKAWGYCKKTPRARWNTIVLSDADIVHLANLRLCVDRYGVSAERVVSLQKAGKGFATIHGELAREPGRSAGKGKPNGGEQGKGKAKGKPKDKDRP